MPKVRASKRKSQVRAPYHAALAPLWQRDEVRGHGEPHASTRQAPPVRRCLVHSSQLMLFLSVPVPSLHHSPFRISFQSVTNTGHRCFFPPLGTFPENEYCSVCGMWTFFFSLTQHRKKYMALQVRWIIPVEIGDLKTLNMVCFLIIFNNSSLPWNLSNLLWVWSQL